MYGRYLTKICDQVIALLSLEHSRAIVWTEQDSDTESVDIEACDSDRLFTFEVAESNEQEEKAAARPGFQVLSHSSFSTVPCLIRREDDFTSYFSLGMSS